MGPRGSLFRPRWEKLSMVIMGTLQWSSLRYDGLPRPNAHLPELLAKCRPPGNYGTIPFVLDVERPPDSEASIGVRWGETPC